MKKIAFFVLSVILSVVGWADEDRHVLTSPNGKLVTSIACSPNGLNYKVEYNGTKLLDWSSISLNTDKHASIKNGWYEVKSKSRKVDETIESPFYRQATMENRYNEQTIKLRNGMTVEFRVYNEGVAYRWKTDKACKVTTEKVKYEFMEDWETTAPYVIHFDSTDHERQYNSSFENHYKRMPISELDKRRLCFLPLLVHGPKGVKVCITESGLLNYPGLYLHGTGEKGVLTGEHAPLPDRVEQGGYGNLQEVVKGRKDYIAEMAKGECTPWRIVMVAENSAELAMNNMSYLLAEPSRVKDISWIKPGKSAWEWWNSWHLEKVDFEAGINTQTYKAYIDFASKYGLDYVIMDEGWSVRNEADLMKVVPEIDLPEIVNYGKGKGVGIILWAGHYAFDRDMERVCQHYSEMGIKGFKIDFMDRDDQWAVDFYRRAAEMCAKYRLVVDFHGAFKPAGFTRTYPNVLNFEGVFGLEQMRWAKLEWDQMKYDTEIPFIRQAAGPMDYTPGAMLNGTQNTFRPNSMEPMSQGTRCHQLALYVVLDMPLAMLCDSPSNYEKETEFTKMLAEIPTTWDETRVLAGEVGEYIVTARRKGNLWYIGGITNWEARTVEFDLSFIGNQRVRSATMYLDSPNSKRWASDYQTTRFHPYNPKEKIGADMAPGGGFLMKVEVE